MRDRNKMGELKFPLVEQPGLHRLRSNLDLCRREIRLILANSMNNGKQQFIVS